MVICVIVYSISWVFFCDEGAGEDEWTRGTEREAFAGGDEVVGAFAFKKVEAVGSDVDLGLALETLAEAAYLGMVLQVAFAHE